MNTDRKILIVDDEAHIRLLIAQTLEDLEDHGIRLLIAEDGEEALNLILKEKPDLVFLDVMMPKMNGFDVCDRIKNSRPDQDTTIVLLTAKGQEVDRQRAEHAGADRYMTKPFDPDELYELARELIGIK
jgi:DNA-binding response OmpR family regulator